MMDFRSRVLGPINERDEWAVCSTMFDRHYVNANKTVIKIPKKLHQIWLGSALPDKYKRIRDTWLNAHPDWEYRLWTSNDAQAFGMRNANSFSRTGNLGAKSDIFRYEILHRHGGLYIDTDFECIKSFNDLLYLDFFTGNGRGPEPWFFNGLIACAPGHPIMAEILGRLGNAAPGYQEIMATTGPLFFTPIVHSYMKSHPDEKVVVFPTAFFYAFPSDHRHLAKVDTEASRAEVRKHITEDSYCLHLWYTSWQGG